MASLSAIGESGAVVSADSINYEQKLFSHPSYRFEIQFPNTFGQAISLTTSQTPVTINIPPQVFNWSHSYLNYTVNLPAGGLTYMDRSKCSARNQSYTVLCWFKYVYC